MTTTRQAYSRRDFFGSFFRRGREAATPEPIGTEAQVAIIQGRFCLAYQKSFCSVCSERCPESEAIVIEGGIPRIVADNCTGCSICRDVCPAPRNAILIKPCVTA